MRSSRAETVLAGASGRAGAARPPRRRENGPGGLLVRRRITRPLDALSPGGMVRRAGGGGNRGENRMGFGAFMVIVRRSAVPVLAPESRGAGVNDG
jgi:hypothetical protein